MTAPLGKSTHPHEAVWSFYVVCVVGVDLLFGVGRGQGSPGAHALLHLGLLIVVLSIPRVLRSPLALAVARGTCTLVGLPIAFSSLAWILPALHPEPFEWNWIALDRAMLGFDPTVAAQSMLRPIVTELLQVVYSLFYFVPMVAVLVAGRRGGVVAFERALVTVLFGFALSYLGYLLWPTLPPYRFLWHADPIEGVWLAARIHAALDAAEVHRWDCFPSGHTMLSIISVVLVWRHDRRIALLLAPVAALIVVSTIALRYHYASDVVAGLIAVPLALGATRRVLSTLAPPDSQTI